MPDIGAILQRSPVIPVAKIHDASSAVPFAEALLAGGIDVIEVTLRTDAAVDAIAQIKARVPRMCVGVGTAWQAADAERAVEAGAKFVVSPGRADEVFAACRDLDVPYLPGAQTASEIAYWVGQGLSAVKFFPASSSGGVAALKALAAVFPGLAICPTGGISAANAAEYLALPAVPCVGGSWLAAGDLIGRGDWQGIEHLAAQATTLGKTA